MKRLLLFLSIIVFKNSQTMQGEVAGPVRPLTLPEGIGQPINSKTVSPRQALTSSSPRKSAKELQANGEKIIHPLLARAQSELRLGSLNQSNNEEELKKQLKKLNADDKHHTMVQIQRRSSGSSSPLSNSKGESEFPQEIEDDLDTTSVPSIIVRRNTISL